MPKNEDVPAAPPFPPTGCLDDADPAASPRVSVVIPAFQASRWIGRTVASVLCQRLRALEVIVVDDGSTDDLDGALAAARRRDARLRLVRQNNRGLAGARNRGIAEARADLVAPLDADDIWHPDFLAETVAALDRDPAAPFAFARYFRMDEDDRLLDAGSTLRPVRHDLVGLLWENSVGSGSAGVYRRALMQAAGGFDETMAARGLSGAEDWKLALLLAQMGDPVHVDRTLVGYRLHRTSMSQENPRRQLAAVMAVLEDIREGMPEIAEQHFADARTGMIAWLLPAFARNRQLRDLLTGIWRGYLRNPLWLRNPALRRSHARRVRMAWSLLARRGATNPGPPLHRLAVDGAYPFAFLAPDDAAMRR